MLTEEQKKNLKEADNSTLLMWLHSLGWSHTSGLDEKTMAVENEILSRMEVKNNLCHNYSQNCQKK